MGVNEPRLLITKPRGRSSWCVFIDGQLISDHATHEAARVAARNHLPLLQREAPDGD